GGRPGGGLAGDEDLAGLVPGRGLRRGLPRARGPPAGPDQGQAAEHGGEARGGAAVPGHGGLRYENDPTGRGEP
ncbi:unnamed protein product, partial [Heterosigma akashiwo]